MVITIFDRVGKPKADISPGDSSTQVTEIQGDNVLTLSFTHHDHIPLDVDDYVDFEGERYRLTEAYRPVQKSTAEWSYDIKLYGIQSLIRNFLVIKRVDGEDDPVFTLTAPPREHVAMIVNCMNDGAGHITDWKVGQVDGTENIVIDYHGKYCDEALKEIAEKVGAEWWIEGQTVNVCRCEHGEPVVLGYDKGLTGITPDKADNVKFYTRLYPVGSSRNIDKEKYGFSRLQLPDGQKYVEVNADKYGRVDHYEADAFAGIYPRRIGEVSSVRSEVKTGEDGNPFTIYYFRDNNLPFDPNDYEIGGMVKRVSFQEGSELGGLGQEENGTYYFEVNYDSDTREFEIITIWPYDNDVQLPGGALVPKAGDKYILWNLRMPDEYYSLAEEELLTAVNKYNEDHSLDVTVFKAPTDHVWIEDNDVELFIGRRVRLESEEYFPGAGYRDSRITKITRKVNLPSLMDIEIGDALSRTSMQKMADSITDARSYARGLSESVALPDIIRTGDRTAFTDNNILSAKRSREEFLSKKQDDRAAGKIRFDRGVEFGDAVLGVRGGFVDGSGAGELRSLVGRERLEVGEFFPGQSGAALWIDDEGVSHAEADVLHVRRKLTAKEVEIQKETHVGGSIISSPAGAVVTRVEPRATGWALFFASEDATGRKVGNEFALWDQVRCQTFNLEREADGTVGNRYWWRLCTERGTVNSVYDERTGARAVNYCAEPRPLGLQMTADGYFKTAAGGWTGLTRVPRAGERVTVRLRGRFAGAVDGGAHIVDVWTGGNWDVCFRLSGDEFEGGKAGETVSVSFDWPEGSTERWLMLRTARWVDGAWLQDPEARLESVALMRGEGVAGEPVTEHFVEVSAEDCDAAGTSVPQAGDEIHTVGNRHIPSRRNVIFLTSYDAGAGVAPCLLCYSQISDYSLGEDNLTARLSPAGNFIRGEFKVLADGGVYKDVRDWVKGLDAAALLEMTEKLNDSEKLTQSRFEQTNKAIDMAVTELKGGIDGVTKEVASLKIEADHISAQVSSSSFEIPNLCTTPFVDAGVTTDGYFKEDGQYFTLSDELQAGERVAVRLRGRFAQCGVVELYLGSWSMGTSIAHGEDTFEGGRDDEDFVAVVTVPAGGEAGRLLVVRTRRWGSAGWEYDADCRLRYIAVVRGDVMPLAYGNEDSVAEALLPTGIDIRRGKVTVTSDNFEVRNNAGETTALIDAQGKLTTSLIDADKITARHVVAGDEKGQRVEIDPTLCSIEIYDGAGAQCTVLDGTAYADGPSDLGVFGGERAVAIGPVSSGKWSRKNALSGTVGLFQSEQWDCPAGTLRLSGSLTLTAVLMARKAGEADSSGHLVNIADETAVLTATLTLTVGGERIVLGDRSVQANYVAAGIGQAASYPAQSQVVEVPLNTTPVTVTSAAKGQLTLELRNNSRCTADKYEVRADWRLSLRETVSQYVSRYFANGFLLGNSSTRYVSAWHGTDGLMHVEARNDGTGFRLTDGGVEMMAAEGVWARVPVFLTRLFVEPQPDGTVKVYGAGGGVAGVPAASLSGATVTLTYPAAWRSLGLTGSNVIVNLTPSKEGGEAVLSGTSESGLTVGLRVNGAAAPGHFYVELWRM